MTVEAAGIFSHTPVRATGTESKETVPQENWQDKLQQSNIWDFSGYFNGNVAQTAHNA